MLVVEEEVHQTLGPAAMAAMAAAVEGLLVMMELVQEMQMEALEVYHQLQARLLITLVVVVVAFGQGQALRV